MAHTVVLFTFLFVYTLPPGATSFSISWFCCHVLYYPSIENAHKNFCRPCTFLDVRADFYSAMKNTPRQIFSQQLCCETLGQDPGNKTKVQPNEFQPSYQNICDSSLQRSPHKWQGKAKHPSLSDGTDLHCRSIWLAVRAAARSEQRAAVCVGGAEGMHFSVSRTAPAAAPGEAAPRSETQHKPGPQHGQKQLLDCCAWQNRVNIIYWWQISKRSKTNGARANLQSCMFSQGECRQVTSSFEARETEKLNQ